MMNRLDGKTVFVTASAQGIGRACAIALAGEGAKVIATDINTRKLKELTEIQNIITATLDVTSVKDIQSCANKYSEVNVVLNCAGYVHHGNIMDCNLSDWTHSLNLNVTSMFTVIQTFLPNLISRGGGSVINIASVAGSIKGIVNRCAYGTTKAAVIGLTKSVAADYVTNGIRANAICPGTVDTPSLAERIRASGDEELARQAFIDRQPMKRLGTPEEIANVAVYLASDESRFMTGQTIVIDGGITL